MTRDVAAIVFLCCARATPASVDAAAAGVVSLVHLTRHVGNTVVLLWRLVVMMDDDDDDDSGSDDDGHNNDVCMTYMYKLVRSSIVAAVTAAC